MAEKVNERNNVSKMADKGGNIIHPAINRINPEYPHQPEPDPTLLSSGIAQKKKSQFRITSVSTHNSNDGEVDSADDLDESHTEDASSELIDVSKSTDIDQDPSSEDTVSNDNNEDIVNCNNTTYQTTRFKVVKIESTEPFKRGRWICMDFLDPPVQEGKLELGIGLIERDIASGNSSAGSSVHFVPGDNHPSENPLAAHGLDSTFNHPTTENMLYTTAQSLPHNFPNTNQNIEYTHLTSQTVTMPMNIPLTGNIQQTIPQNISNISAPPQMLQQTNVHKNVLQGVPHTITSMPPNIAQNISQSTPSSIPTVLSSGIGHTAPTNLPTSVISSVISQSNPTGMTSVLHQGLPQTTSNLQTIHPQGMQQSAVPGMPQNIPSNIQSSMLQQTISQNTPGIQQILHQGLSQTQPIFPQSSNLQPHMGQQILTNVPHSIQSGPSNIKTITNSCHPINQSQTLVGTVEGGISSHTQNSSSNTDTGVGTPLQQYSAPISSASDISVGNPTPPQAEHVTLVQTVKDSIEEETDSTSGSSTVAIDNKIEQAMDLVKSHLMFAVREEVEVLKERITELMERIGQLEYENNILKANAPPETLESLAQLSSTMKPHSQAPPSSS